MLYFVQNPISTLSIDKHSAKIAGYAAPPSRFRFYTFVSEKETIFGFDDGNDVDNDDDDDDNDEDDNDDDDLGKQRCTTARACLCTGTA